MICPRAVAFVLLLLSTAAWSPASGAARTYRDANGYFSFNPPRGWVKQELSGGTTTKVLFETPAGDAGMVMIVRPRHGTRETLGESQRKLLKNQRLHFPEGKFLVSGTEVAGYRASKMEIDIPGQIRQDFYLFMSGDLFFNINCFAADKETFDRYWGEASAALRSIRPA